MASGSSRYSSVFKLLTEASSWHGRMRYYARIGNRKSIFLAAAVLVAAAASLIPLAFAQGKMSKIASVDPPTGKVSDTVTLTGENLGKSSVVGVFLTGDRSDYKATLVSQTDDKFVITVPLVKSGGKILILPVRFWVEE